MSKPAPNTERALTDQIRDLAATFHWRRYHTWLSKHSTAGFPDEVLVRGNRLIFAELKNPTAQPTTAQTGWLDDLANTGAEVCLWRPDMLPDIAVYLLDRHRPTTPPGAWTPDRKDTP